MRKNCLFLLALVCLSCTDQTKQKAVFLNNELKLVTISSSAFDSLLLEAQTLPPQQKTKIFLEICNRNEVEVDKTKKQEELLVETLTFASKKDKKKVLQRLIALYRVLDKFRYEDAIAKGIKYCDELERNYSLTAEERWDVKK